MKREKAKQFQDLIVWQKAHQFVLGVYKHSKNFLKVGDLTSKAILDSGY